MEINRRLHMSALWLGLALVVTSLFVGVHMHQYQGDQQLLTKGLTARILHIKPEASGLGRIDISHDLKPDRHHHIPEISDSLDSLEMSFVLPAAQ